MPRSVFLSHSSEDAVYASEFRLELERHGFIVYYAPTHLKPGEFWNNQLALAITKMDIFILLLTQRSVESRYVQAEVNFALTRDKTMFIVDVERVVWNNLADPFQHIIAVNRPIPEVVHEISLHAERLRLTDPSRPLRTAAELEEADDLVPDALRHYGFRGRFKVLDQGRQPPKRVSCILPPTIEIPGGVYSLGSDTHHDTAAAADETPIIRQDIATFAVSKFPVTVAEYACAVQSGAVHKPVGQISHQLTWDDQLRHPTAPVANVSWDLALSYVTWLTGLTGYAYSLPLESYWEAAARGNPSNDAIYPWGNSWRTDAAAIQGGNERRPSPVDAHPEGWTSLGVADMAGNVWEWTQSFYTDTLDAQPSDETRDIVLRGGSWNSKKTDARIARRYHYPPETTSATIGFRMIQLQSIHHTPKGR